MDPEPGFDRAKASPQQLGLSWQRLSDVYEVWKPQLLQDDGLGGHPAKEFVVWRVFQGAVGGCHSAYH